MNLRTIENIYNKTRSYIQRNGVAETAVRSIEGFKEAADNVLYASEARKREEAKRVLPQCGEFEKNIRFSLLIPTYDPDPEDFNVLMKSIADQTYKNLEVVIADAGKTDNVENCVQGYKDSGRLSDIIYIKLQENKGISGNTNEALKAASGDYVALIDHDDFLSVDAFEAVAGALQSGADIVYTDEDKYYGPEDKYFTPNRKPDFNLDLLLSNNYICHLFVVKRSIALETGGFRMEFDGAQDYDFILRCTELTERDKIIHVPEILYHWRASDGSTADNPESKLYAYESGRKVLEAWLKRHEINGCAEHTNHRGFYRITYSDNELPEYKVLIGERLYPENDENEKILASYFARKEVGAVGARVVGRLGNIISSGYTTDSYGRRVPLYDKMNMHFSGYMHRAAMQQDVEAVSNKACVVRSDLMKYYDKDPMKMFSRIREAGYLVVVDPEVVYRFI